MRQFRFGLPFVAAVLLVGCGSKDTATMGNAPRTEAASAVSGWKEIKTSGVALSFPPDWQAIDVSAGNVQQSIQNVFGSDPQSKDLAEQTKKMAEAGMFKLFVFAPATAGSTARTNCNLIVNDIPQDATIEQIVQLNGDQLKGLTQDGKVDTSYVTTPAGKIGKLSAKVKAQTPGGLNSTVYIALKGRKIAVITFTANDAEQPATAKVADQSIQTFKFE